MQLPVTAPRLKPQRRSNRRLSLALAPIGLIGFGWLGWTYAVPQFFGARQAEMPLTSQAQRGELKITVGDRGELESIDAVTVTCELEGGGKIATIVEEVVRPVLQASPHVEFIGEINDARSRNSWARPGRCFSRSAGPSRSAW